MNDKYKISINSLVLTSAPKTTTEFQQLLFDYGYYGRATVERQPTKSYSNVHVKALIYLPDSCFTYSWPAFTYYDLSSRSFGKRKKPRVISNEFRLKKCLTFLCLNKIVIDKDIETVAHKGATQFGWATKDDYIKMIQVLLKAGLFNKGTFLLRHPNDIQEVYSNLFDPNYFGLD
jgi:hypothetical protein